LTQTKTKYNCSR